MMDSSQRVAQPGDIFILLEPPAQELQQLHQWQTELQARYGGQIVEYIHVTCQRFTPPNQQVTADCIATLTNEITDLRPFPLRSDGLIQFYTRYWQKHVLRWQIQETAAWRTFQNLLEINLARLGCPSHYTRRRRTTCSALNLPNKLDLPGEIDTHMFPCSLFTVHQIVISRLNQQQDFEILETIEIGS